MLHKKMTWCCRDCKGHECLMELTPGPPLCMLKVVRPDAFQMGPIVNLTCGLHPDDDLVQQPGNHVFNSSAGGNQKVQEGYPHEIHQKVFFPCYRSKLHSVVRLTFPEILADKYTCLGSPKCINNTLSSHIVCYTTGNVRTSYVNASFEGSGHHVLLGVLLAWFIYFMC